MKKDIDMRFFANAKFVPRDDFEKKKFSFPVTGSDQKTLFSQKKCQNFEKLTKIYQKSECPFQIAYDLNFHFPKKLIFLQAGNFLWPLLRRVLFGYFGFYMEKWG